jgi:prepilin-type N-terminal cleavage/methylation domain-containing protein
MNQSNRNDSGFTLLELTVVVAIVGIMASLVGPTFERMHARARNTEAKVLARICN